MTYSLLDSCGNHSILAKSVVDNLLMCGIRVNTHTFSSRVFYRKHIKYQRVSNPVLLTISSDLYLHNGAPPLRVAAQEALHHHITALSVGIHRAFSETSYFI